MANRPYEFLDDIGTLEFYTVGSDAAEGLFTNRILSSLPSDSVDDDHLLAASTTLSIVQDLLNRLRTMNSTLDDVRTRVIPGMITQIGLDRLTHLRIEFVTGNIRTEVPDPQSDVLYMQHDNEDDDTWALYVYTAPTDGSGGGQKNWLCVGEYILTLNNYWSKTTDVEEIASLVFDFISDERIKQAAYSAYGRVRA